MVRRSRVEVIVRISHRDVERFPQRHVCRSPDVLGNDAQGQKSRAADDQDRDEC